MISISIPVTAIIGGAVRIAIRRLRTGLLRLRTVLVLVLVARRLTVTQGTVRVATGRPGARLIGLWTVLVAGGLTFTFRTIWVAAGFTWTILVFVAGRFTIIRTVKIAARLAEPRRFLGLA